MNESVYAGLPENPKLKEAERARGWGWRPGTVREETPDDTSGWPVGAVDGTAPWYPIRLGPPAH